VAFVLGQLCVSAKSDRWIFVDLLHSAGSLCERFRDTALNMQGLDDPDCNLSCAGMESKSSSVVKLNVGGTVYCTTADTLLRSGPSFFSGLLSVHFKQVLHEGALFIDRDGCRFRYVLNFLRNGTVVCPNDLVVLRELLEEATFFGLCAMTKMLQERINELDLCLQMESVQPTSSSSARRVSESMEFSPVHTLRAGFSSLTAVSNQRRHFIARAADQHSRSNASSMNGTPSPSAGPLAAPSSGKRRKHSDFAFTLDCDF